MALKAGCLLYILFFGILYTQQQQSFDVKFDEPSIKYVELGSKTSMTCYIYGELQALKKKYKTIQIVKVLDGYEEENNLDGMADVFVDGGKVLNLEQVLTKGRNVLSDDNYKIDINPVKYPPYKYHILFTILSAKISDDRHFICRFTDLKGDVHKSRIRLQVVKTPEQLICRKYYLFSNLEVTCSAVVYPHGKCDVISSHDGNPLSSSSSFNEFEEVDDLFITTCIIEVPISYVFKIRIAPDVPSPTNFTLHSNSISANICVGHISSMTANGEYDSVTVNPGGHVRFSCEATGTKSTQIYLFREKRRFMKLLASGSSTERLQLEIDNVTPDDEGVYTCQVGYDATSSKYIEVKVESGDKDSEGVGDSDSQDDVIESYSHSQSIIIITISLSIGVLVLIVSIVVCTTLWVRRRRKARRIRTRNSGIVLATPSAPAPDNEYVRCDEYESCLQTSLPPYAIACNKDYMPPSYPEVILNSGSQTNEQSSHGTQLGSPPPYSWR